MLLESETVNLRDLPPEKDPHCVSILPLPHTRAWDPERLRWEYRNHRGCVLRFQDAYDAGQRRSLSEVQNETVLAEEENGQLMLQVYL